jgi:hypothetical protein
MWSVSYIRDGKISEENGGKQVRSRIGNALGNVCIADNRNNITVMHESSLYLNHNHSLQ